MSTAPWSEFHRRWAKLQPPLRPNAEVVAALTAAIAGHDDHVLQLGLTPELTTIARDTTAVDWSETMLAAVWLGNSATRRAVRGNWLYLAFALQSFSAVIGDGSLNCLLFPQQYQRIFGELARVLRPGARLAIRMYLTPKPCESLSALRETTLARGVGRIDAMKWRIANALCAERGDSNLPVQAILDAFNSLFPDRTELMRATGWSAEHIEMIDRYASLPDVFSFPTADDVLASLPKTFAQARFVPSGSYELADRCPILTAEFQP